MTSDITASSAVRWSGNAPSRCTPFELPVTVKLNRAVSVLIPVTAPLAIRAPPCLASKRANLRLDDPALRTRIAGRCISCPPVIRRTFRRRGLVFILGGTGIVGLVPRMTVRFVSPARAMSAVTAAMTSVAMTEEVHGHHPSAE